jgi:hypothetical protein
MCAAAVALAVALAACGGGGDPEPTVVPTETLAPTPTVDPNGPATPLPLTDANSQIVSDGVCAAAIPSGWVDDGTGRGSTPSGARYTLFGGRAASDVDWQRAVELVRDQATNRAGAEIEETPTSILVTYAEHRGFEYRVRFGVIYCDIAVSSTSRSIPATERAYWDAVMQSLAPAS